MWSSFWNYINENFFGKPKVSQKRRLEECNECPPKKHMRLDNPDIQDSLGTWDKYPDSNRILMESTKNYNVSVEDECIFEDSPQNKWATTSTMARKSIKRSQFSSETVLTPGKTKSASSSKLMKDPQNLGNGSDDILKSENKKRNEVSRSISDRIFSNYQRSTMMPNGVDKSMSLFQGKLKKRLNFLQESYRLKEKYQYMQLLQSQTTDKLHMLLGPLNKLHRISSNKSSKSTIPVIDLTKDRSTLTINKSHENIPWTASWSRLQDAESEVQIRHEKESIPKVNSLQDILKTNPVTSDDVVKQILLHHAKETAERRRLVEIESSKLEVLSESNKRAFGDALEERLRTYMRITEPPIDETEEEAYVLPELTAAQEEKISAALKPASPAQILVEKFGLQIKRRDIQTLKGTTWLNDEVINFYMNLIMERGKSKGLPNVYAFNTFFYPKLLSSGHSSLKRWTKKVDIFSYDLLIVPVHLGMHWCLAVLDLRVKEIRYYDSMGSPNNRCLRSLLSYLEDESLDKKKKSYDIDDWRQINVTDIPQQMNGSDCGVFACQFAEHLARECSLLFTQEHMPYFRRKMILEILEANLLT